MERTEKQMVRVEACCKCHEHAATQPHAERQYALAYAQLQRLLGDRGIRTVRNRPPRYLQKLKDTELSSKRYRDTNKNKVVEFPALGAFQVYYKGVLVYSKLEIQVLPDVGYLALLIQCLREMVEEMPEVLEGLGRFRDIEYEWRKKQEKLSSLYTFVKINSFGNEDTEIIKQVIIKQARSNIKAKKGSRRVIPYTLYEKKEKQYKINNIYCPNRETQRYIREDKNQQNSVIPKYNNKTQGLGQEQYTKIRKFHRPQSCGNQTMRPKSAQNSGQRNQIFKLLLKEGQSKGIPVQNINSLIKNEYLQSPLKNVGNPREKWLTSRPKSAAVASKIYIPEIKASAQSLFKRSKKENSPISRKIQQKSFIKLINPRKRISMNVVSVSDRLGFKKSQNMIRSQQLFPKQDSVSNNTHEIEQAQQNDPSRDMTSKSSISSVVSTESALGIKKIQIGKNVKGRKVSKFIELQNSLVEEELHDSDKQIEGRSPMSSSKEHTESNAISCTNPSENINPSIRSQQMEHPMNQNESDILSEKSSDDQKMLHILEATVRKRISQRKRSSLHQRHSSYLYRYSTTHANTKQAASKQLPLQLLRIDERSTEKDRNSQTERNSRDSRGLACLRERQSEHGELQMAGSTTRTTTERKLSSKMQQLR